jgi:peptidyl-dipeptidase Dcp
LSYGFGVLKGVLAIANNPAKPGFQNTVLALETGVDLKELQAFCQFSRFAI